MRLLPELAASVSKIDSCRCHEVSSHLPAVSAHLLAHISQLSVLLTAILVYNALDEYALDKNSPTKSGPAVVMDYGR